jgi:predicted  nucleic acid-binding Zn-ribbon protein
MICFETEMKKRLKSQKTKKTSNSSYDKIQVENESLKEAISNKEDQLKGMASPDEKMRQLSNDISHLNSNGKSNFFSVK